jgi:hypothetical protein
MENHVTANGATEHERLVATAARLLANALHGAYAGYNTHYDKMDAEDDQKPSEGDLTRLNYLITGFRNYSSSTLRKIISMRTDNLYYVHYSIIDLIIRGEVPVHESFVNDYLHFTHCFETTVILNRITQAVLALESFSYYDGMVPQYLGHEYPVQRIEQGTAILTIVSHMKQAVSSGATKEELLSGALFKTPHEALSAIVENHSNDVVLYIKNENLRSLLVNPEADLEGITKLTTERNIFNGDDIIAVLDAQKTNPAPAVSDGTL